MTVIYRCPKCHREHRRELVTKTREYPCVECEKPVVVVLPPVLEKPKRKSRSKKIVT